MHATEVDRGGSPAGAADVKPRTDFTREELGFLIEHYGDALQGDTVPWLAGDPRWTKLREELARRKRQLELFQTMPDGDAGIVPTVDGGDGQRYTLQ